VTGRKLVAWQLDLRHRAGPARKSKGEPRVLRITRHTHLCSGGSPDGSGILELTFSQDTWAREGFCP
jgi:hypothetical protein